MKLLYLVLPALASTLVTIPQPTGPYGVSIIDVEFVDNRTDPYTGAPERKLPVSIITPTGPFAECQSVQQMYMPYATAEFWEQEFPLVYNLSVSLNNTFSQVALSLCKPVANHRQYPLIFFSPGEGISRQFYNILGSNIAAQGYTVITIDAPGQVDFIQFLDGSIEYAEANITTDAQTAAAIDVRVQDIQFILNSISKEDHASWRQYCSPHPSPAIYGHSLGGAAALSSIVVDQRFVGGADMDGSFYGAPLMHTTTKPFLIFASDMQGALQHNQPTVPSWATVWQNLLGPKWQLQIKGSAHGTFEDVAVLAGIIDLYQVPGVMEILGSIAPQEALDIQVSTLSTLAAFLFGQTGVESVVKEAASFQEVVVVNTTNVS